MMNQNHLSAAGSDFAEFAVVLKSIVIEFVASTETINTATSDENVRLKVLDGAESIITAGLAAYVESRKPAPEPLISRDAMALGIGALSAIIREIAANKKKEFTEQKKDKDHQYSTFAQGE